MSEQTTEQDVSKERSSAPSGGMRVLAKRLAKDSLTYGGLGILQKAIGFFLLPMYTRLLTPDDYGVLEVANTAVFFLEIFVLLQIPSAMMRWYLMVAETEEEKRVVMGTSARIVLASAVVVCLGMFLAQGPLTQIVFGGGEYRAFLWVMIGNTFLVGLFQLRTQFYRTQGKAKEFSVQQIVFFVLSLGFQILFVVYFRMKAFGAMVGALCSLGVMALWCLPWFVRHLRMPFSRKHAKDMLAFSLPMLPGAVALWVLNSSNRYFIRQYGGLTEVGLFGIASKITMIFLLVSNAFITAWGPVRYELAKDADGKRLLARTATYYFAAMGLFALGMTVFSWDAIHIMTTEKFFAAQKLVPFLVFGSLLNSLHYLVGVGVTLSGKTLYHALIFGSAAVLNVGLNIWLGPTYQAVGAAVAFLLSNAVAVVLFFLMSQRLYPLNFEYARLAKLAVALAIPLFASFGVGQVEGVFGMLTRTCLFLAGVLLLVLFSFPEKGEIRALRRLIGNG